MPRYSLLARCSVLLLLGFQMLTLLHTYVYFVMMMIVVLLYFFSRSFFSFSPVHSLPFSLTLFFPSECILFFGSLIHFIFVCYFIFVLLKMCASICILCVCECMPLRSTQTLNVCQTHRIQVLSKHILRTCILYIISNFCVCYLGGQTTLDCIHTTVRYVLYIVCTHTFSTNCQHSSKSSYCIQLTQNIIVFVRIFWIRKRLISLRQVYNTHTHVRTHTTNQFMTSVHSYKRNHQIFIRVCKCACPEEMSNLVDEMYTHSNSTYFGTNEFFFVSFFCSSFFSLHCNVYLAIRVMRRRKKNILKQQLTAKIIGVHRVLFTDTL